MKRHLFDSMFWGLFLVLIGLLVILRDLFGFNIHSVWPIIWPIIIIYIGMGIIFNRRHRHDDSSDHDNDIVFSESEVKYQSGKSEYNTVFGKGEFDLSEVAPPKEGVLRIEVNTIFGTGTIRIKKSAAIKVKMTAVFGAGIFPNGNSVTLGESKYTTKAFKEGSGHILLEVNSIFGKTNIIEF